MENYKGYRPTQNYVVLKVNKKESDIVLLDDSNMRKEYLEVVAVGSKVTDVSPGEFVIVHARVFPKQIGAQPDGTPIVAPGQGITLPEIGGETLIQVMDYDVIGIMEESLVKEFM